VRVASRNHFNAQQEAGRARDILSLTNPELQLRRTSGLYPCYIESTALISRAVARWPP